MDISKEHLITALQDLKNSHYVDSDDFKQGFDIGIVMCEAMLEYVFIQVAKKKDAQGKFLHVDMFDEILNIREAIDAVRK